MTTPASQGAEQLAALAKVIKDITLSIFCPGPNDGGRDLQGSSMSVTVTEADELHAPRLTAESL